MIEWALVIPAFVGVFTKVFQQLNAFHKLYLVSVPTSYLISVCDVFVIGGVAHYGIAWGTVNGLFVGGVSGHLLATWMHGRLFKEPDIDTQGITKLLRIFRRMGR